MTIYRVYRDIYVDFGITEEETIGYYRTREMADYVANHYKENPEEEVGAGQVEEIEVQTTCPVYED